MNQLTKYISSQFKNPRGIGGVIITMIQNVANKELYKATVSAVDINAGEKLYSNLHKITFIP